MPGGRPKEHTKVTQSTEMQRKVVRRDAEGRPIKPAPFTLQEALEFYRSDTFPDIQKRATSRYAYPRPTEKAKWVRLLNSARLWYYRRRLADWKGQKGPVIGDHLRNKYAYLLFHVQKYSRCRRSLRVQHRRKLGLKVGDERVVHHEDPRTMSLERAVVLDHCHHQRVHGKVCALNKKGGQGGPKGGPKKQQKKPAGPVKKGKPQAGQKKFPHYSRRV